MFTRLLGSGSRATAPFPTLPTPASSHTPSASTALDSAALQAFLSEQAAKQQRELAQWFAEHSSGQQATTATPSDTGLDDASGMATPQEPAATQHEVAAIKKRLEVAMRRIDQLDALIRDMQHSREAERIEREKDRAERHKDHADRQRLLHLLQNGLNQFSSARHVDDKLSQLESTLRNLVNHPRSPLIHHVDEDGIDGIGLPTPHTSIHGGNTSHRGDPSTPRTQSFPLSPRERSRRSLTPSESSRSMDHENFRVETMRTLTLTNNETSGDAMDGFRGLSGTLDHVDVLVDNDRETPSDAARLSEDEGWRPEQVEGDIPMDSGASASPGRILPGRQVATPLPLSRPADPDEEPEAVVNENRRRSLACATPSRVLPDRASRARSVVYHGHPLDGSALSNQRSKRTSTPSSSVGPIRTAKQRHFGRITQYSAAHLPMSNGVPRNHAEWPEKLPNTLFGRRNEIYCDVCKGPAHFMCAGFGPNDDLPEKWICPYCDLDVHKKGRDPSTIEIAKQDRCIRGNCRRREKQMVIRQEGDEDEYWVEAIVGRRGVDGGGLQYLVKWAGWAYDWCTWEPENHVEKNQEKIQEFIEAAVKLGLDFSRPVLLPITRKWWTDGGELKERYKERQDDADNDNDSDDDDNDDSESSSSALGHNRKID